MCFLFHFPWQDFITKTRHIGAKMGIRAQKLLRAHLNPMTVISQTGSRPPYSCLSDGIQVSTGPVSAEEPFGQWKAMNRVLISYQGRKRSL